MKTTALAMAITDSELSDEEASILESGGFSVSRATTPQLTDLSEGERSLASVSHCGFTPVSPWRALPATGIVNELIARPFILLLRLIQFSGGRL